MSFLGASVLLLVVGATPACSKPRQARRPDSRPLVKPGGLAAGNPRLVEAMQAVLSSCEVSDTGRASGCPDLEWREHRRTEQAVGSGPALLTYCHGLGDKRAKVRALSGAGLSRLAYYRSILPARDPGLLDCLLSHLRRQDKKNRRVRRPLARTAAYLATALRQEKRLLGVLEATEEDAVKEAGYGALWANGRLRVFDALSRLIRDPKAPSRVRVAAIKGFAIGGPLLPAERAKVCRVVPPLISDKPPVASVAAKCTARFCPRFKERVLSTAEKLAKEGSLDPDFISAVRAVDSPLQRATREQRGRILALLEKVVEDSRFDDSTRAAALSKIGWIDRRLCVKLARKHAKAAEGALRQSIDWILPSAGR
jgi:hypothetical protein